MLARKCSPASDGADCRVEPRTPHAEISLQRRHVPADGRGRERQAPSGRGEAVRLRAANERLQIGQGFQMSFKFCSETGTTDYRLIRWE